MKIQLYLEQYKNLISQFEDCTPVSIQDIDKIPQSSCTLIHLGNCHDFVPDNISFLHNVVSKLRYGGRLIIEGTDLLEVATALIPELISIDDVQDLLFHGRYHCYPDFIIIDQVRKLGLSIITHRLNQYKYSIIAERPNVSNTM